MELKNKVVVITGGSKGFGRSLAEEFIKEGAKVAICADHTEALNDAAKEMGALGIVADVRNEQALQNVLDQTLEKFGVVDIWINNAGLWMMGAPEDVDMSEVKNMFDVNVVGTINGMRVALRYMQKKNDGVIMNILSKVALGIRPGLSAYVATKWALNGFIKTVKEEKKDTKISFLTVYPGGLKTSLYDGKPKLESYPNYMDPKIAALQVMENLKQQNPEQDLVILKEGEKILKNA